MRTKNTKVSPVSPTEENHMTLRVDKFSLLAKMGDIVFHSDDLARLWHIQNKNTLYVLLSRLVARGSLFRIQKGLYSIKPPQTLNPLLLGVKALHRYAYVSTETILIQNGILTRASNAHTLISTVSKKFTVGGHAYIVRKLTDRFLYNPIGISSQEGGVRVASPERALADLFYFNPHVYLDAPTLLNAKEVRHIADELGYPITASYYT